MEMEFVDGDPDMVLYESIVDEVELDIEALRYMTDETYHDLLIIQNGQTVVSNCSQECTKLKIQLQHLGTQFPNVESIAQEEKIHEQIERQEQVFSQKVADLKQLRLTLTDKLKSTVEKLTALQYKILNDELIRWKLSQQSAGNGTPIHSNLDCIEKRCQSLVNLIWRNREQIKTIEHLTNELGLDCPGVENNIPALNSQITQLLSSLVTNTFVITEQPRQVMKTNTRFTSTVRLLVGGELNVHMTPPQVKVSIISEAQANALLKSKIATNPEASGEIMNNVGTMEYQPENRQLFLSLGNMQLKKIKRAEKRGAEFVMKEKFSLLFQLEFGLGHGELACHVWTLSLPVVVIVHGNQEPNAWATITWDNAFAEPGRVLFAVPNKVPWAQVAEALNVKFQSATGRCLTEDNLQFLGEKAFRGGNSGSQDYSGLLLSWAQFCKEPLPERNFTFWEWFYAIMKLTREHLRGPWMDGYILGFVGRKKTEEMLASCPPGTFLMRFSDSQLGAIGIASVGNEQKVLMLEPANGKDLNIRGLADRISDFENLMFLYPALPKDHAFSKYYTPISGQGISSNGYVHVSIVTRPIFGSEGRGIASQNSAQPVRGSFEAVNQGGVGVSYSTTLSCIIQPQIPDPSVTQNTTFIA